MTRVGRKVVKIPNDTVVSFEGRIVSVKGPKGELSLALDSGFAIVVDADLAYVSVSDGVTGSSARHGLYRALLANMVTGVSVGFVKDLELVGVGYRVSIQGEALNFALGFSHPVVFEAPRGIQFSVEGQTKIKVAGVDRQLVGQTVSEIISLRSKDSYKGKGIRLAGTVIKTKPGKSVKK